MCINYEIDGDWERIDGVIKRHGKGTFSEAGNKYEGIT
jgi:hypothetical protein